MRAFEVRLNGQKITTAGTGKDGVLSAIVNCLARQGNEDLFFSVSGLISDVNQHVTWIEHQPLQVGDTVQIEVVEAASLDEAVGQKSPEDHRKSKEDYVRKLVKQLGWEIRMPLQDSSS
jgi:hypothetical protein